MSVTHQISQTLYFHLPAALCAIITTKNGAQKIFIMLNLNLRPEEKAALNLRNLYEKYSYSFYKMSRFEEYDFYANKKDFLTSSNILTFTDANGKLMALRPDVTLSIIKHIRDTPGAVQKFYYDEKIYRVPKNSYTFHEISQVGIECTGALEDENLCEVLTLAIMSLHTIAEGRKCILDVSHAGVIAELVPENCNRTEILKCIAAKNIHGLKNLDAPEKLISLMEIDEHPDKALIALTSITGRNSQFERVINSVQNYHDEIRVDFSAVNSLNYYNGIVFRGFIEGIPECILTGGQYDSLMRMMGHKNYKAIGFAVYLDLLGRVGKEHD